MKWSVLFLVATLYAASAHATEKKLGARSGSVSFGGILVKVSVNPDEGTFQIGESKFNAKVQNTKKGRVMTASQRVGIMLWQETLSATLFLDGGDGGNIEGLEEYQCTDVRITIVRTKDDGSQTILKNECAFLD